jgi:hypothetical protein
MRKPLGSSDSVARTIHVSTGERNRSARRRRLVAALVPAQPVVRALDEGIERHVEARCGPDGDRDRYDPAVDSDRFDCHPEADAVPDPLGRRLIGTGQHDEELVVLPYRRAKSERAVRIEPSGIGMKQAAYRVVEGEPDAEQSPAAQRPRIRVTKPPLLL